MRRVSPAGGSSRPPLKKYVTCGYFSVSAVRKLVRPCAASTSASRLSIGCGGKARSERKVLVVLRHGDHVDARRRGTAVELAERFRVGQGARELAHPVRAEVEEDDGIAVAHPADGLAVLVHHTRGWTNSSVSPASYASAIAAPGRATAVPSP
jgi:hypothetical protein